MDSEKAGIENAVGDDSALHAGKAMESQARRAYTVGKAAGVEPCHPK
jgi:hypothetical protein